MALRYDSLSGCKCAYQAALPPPVMELLRSELGCAHECFASPLNQYLGSFCSAFTDTDAAFGSKGSFFEFRPSEGSFECNPPFDSRSIDACLEHVLSLLRATELPLSFVVTVPSLDGTHSDHSGSAFRGLEAYKSAAVQVHAKSHSYLMGLQHRRQNDGVFWHPDLPSTAYVYQNAAGRQQWPIRATFTDQLRRAWDWRGK
jgi:phosphorylated CTD-interacting factor 1